MIGWSFILFNRFIGWPVVQMNEIKDGRDKLRFAPLPLLFPHNPVPWRRMSHPE